MCQRDGVIDIRECQQPSSQVIKFFLLYLDIIAIIDIKSDINFKFTIGFHHNKTLLEVSMRQVSATDLAKMGKCEHQAYLDYHRGQDTSLTARHIERGN